jgi:phosphoribosyl-AMP cyclohydrolase
MSGKQDTAAGTGAAAAAPETAAGADTWLDAITWDERGLVPAIAQEAFTNRVLMVAWMNRAALLETVRTGQAVYWSRSRQRLWRKGEESGHRQRLREVRVDCDADVILLKVDQVGGIACHTGRHNCFFRRLEDGRWVDIDPVLKPASEIYAK